MSRFHSKGKRRREQKAELKASRRLQEPTFDIRWRQVPGDLLRWGELIRAHRAALVKKITVTAGIAIAAFAIGLLLAPLIIEFVITGRSASARVNGSDISLNEYARARDFARYRAIRDLNALAEYQATLAPDDLDALLAVQEAIDTRRIDLLSVDFLTVDDLLTARLLADRAIADHYEIPAWDLDAEREVMLSSARAFPPGVEFLREGTDDRPLPIRVDEMLADLGFDRDTFELLVRGAALSRYYESEAKAGIPEQVLQAHLRYIIAPSQEAADAVVARYRAGESWEDLAWELSTPQRDLVDGGDLGFIPVELFDSRYADAARGLQAGEISEPQPVGTEFYVILAVEWEDERALTAQQLSEMESKAESEFRSELFEGSEVEYLLSSDTLEWAGRHGLRNVGELDPSIGAGPF